MDTRVALVSSPGSIRIETQQLREPREDEVVVRVAECGLCGSDLKLYSGRHPKLQPPLVLGHEFHGTIEVGVGGVEEGERVAVFPPIGCGRCHNCRRGEPHVCVSMTFVGGELDGGLADLVAVPAANLVPMDPAVPDDRRVLVEPLAVGVHAAARASAAPADEVLIIGAGPIGLFTALALRHAGVEHILLADVADERLELARSLGAGATVNTRDTPLAEHVRDAIRPEGVDVAIDCVGGQATAEAALGATRKGGRAVLVGIMPAELRFDGVVLQRGERALIGVQMYTRDDFRTAMEILAAGALIDAADLVYRYPLEDVATAFRDLEAGRRDVLKLVVAP
jgi:2-desacetyl-2-hydroxyethyl bacteriochlorophyllide A dehydrogenase